MTWTIKRIEPYNEGIFYPDAFKEEKISVLFVKGYDYQTIIFKSDATIKTLLNVWEKLNERV